MSTLTTTAKPKAPPVLLQLDHSAEHIPGLGWTLELTAEPAHIVDGELRSFSSFDYDDQSQGLADLQISGRAAAGDPGDTYAWEVCFHRPHTVTLGRAEAMTQTLRRIRRRTDTMTRELGWPESFAAHVLRVAKTLGITQFVCWTQRPDWRAGQTGEWRVMDGQGAAALLDRWIRDFHTEHPAREAS